MISSSRAIKTGQTTKSSTGIAMTLPADAISSSTDYYVLVQKQSSTDSEYSASVSVSILLSTAAPLVARRAKDGVVGP